MGDWHEDLKRDDLRRLAVEVAEAAVELHEAEDRLVVVGREAARQEYAWAGSDADEVVAVVADVLAKRAELARLEADFAKLQSG